jgi:long-chain acyl-CoA synthetase
VNNDFFQRLQHNTSERADEIVFQNLKEDRRATLTYAKFSSEVADLGGFLSGLALVSGDRVGLLMEDGPRWGVAFVAGYSAGLVLVPLDPLQESGAIAATVADAGCKLLIVSERYLDVTKEIERGNVDVFCLQDGETARLVGDQVSATLGVGLTRKLPHVARNPDDDLAIFYTGGTTGSPKGVRLSEANLFWTIRDMAALFPYSSDDNILSVLPLHHIMSLQANFLGPLYLGFKVTYIQSRDPARVLASFHNENITGFLCVPQFYYLLLRRIQEEVARQSWLKRWAFYRLLTLSRILRRRLGWEVGRLLFSPIHSRFGSRFRMFGVGGAIFAEESAELLRDLGFSIFQAYGMTETAGPVTITPPGLDIGVTCGPPMAHARIRIDKPNEDGIGDVLIGGEHVTKGYWNAPQANAELFCDGWLRSGDLGSVDEHGRLRITGRRKEVIALSSGKNVFPELLETYFQTGSPYIKEMCILAIGGRDGGRERLHGVVVPDFERLNKDDVFNIGDRIRYEIESLSAKLPVYQRVHGLEIRRDPLPRTSTRKLKRFAISPRVAQPMQPAPAPDLKSEPELFRLIREIKPIDGAIAPSTNLELDLDFESIERYALFAGLRKRFGLVIDDDEACRISTVGELMRLVEGRSFERIGAADWREILARPLSADQAAWAGSYFDPSIAFTAILFLSSRLLRILLIVVFRFKVDNAAVLPKSGAFIICANHASFLDAFLIASAAPFPVFRRMFYFGASKYGKSDAMQWLWRKLRVVSVDPDLNLGIALRIGADGLSRGFALCVFPEGHRSIDGALRPFRKGPAILAVQSQVPVVPAAVLGSHEVWARGSSRIRIHPIEVRFGSPLSPDGASHEAFTLRIHEAVKQLLDARAPP